MIPTPSFSKYKNFVVTRIVEIPEIQAILTELVHEKTSSTVIHISADDDENLFCLSFATIPNSSNGVAHILEHTVLCGSKKFPVRDPFFSMNRRSLNTFMNAFTGADFTSYPASSQVKADFYNLLAVYLDAVFHPRLSTASFLQEGHRLEFTTKDDPNSPLAIQGIVYNEMKGALSSADARLNEAIMQSLFPTMTYGINSGGDPKDIPSLTHEELKKFHETFYHPSRCLFFFYGNLPLEEELDFIEENALKNATKKEPLPPLGKERRFTEKVERTLYYPATADGDEADKTMVSFAWLTAHVLEQQELLALNVLDLVLMGTDASPLKLALLKSNLCCSIESDLEDEINEVPYIIVCKGCSKNSAPDLEKILFETLQTIAKRGVPLDIIEGAIHQLEMSRLEISVPFGLSLFFRSCLLKQHGGQCEDGLKIHTHFKKLREEVQNPYFLSNLIQKYLLENRHFVRVTMHPDKEMSSAEKMAEEKMLSEIQATLSPEKKKEIVENALNLKKYQEESESLDCLPKITLDSVEKEGKEIALTHEKLGPLNFFYHSCFTNEIVYADLVFDLPEITEQDLGLLRLLTVLMPQLGCGERDYKENLDYVFKHTGGVSADLDLFLQTDNPSSVKPGFILRGKALYRKVDKLFSLFADMLTSVNFTDSERLFELLKDHLEELESSIHNSPLRYAMQISSRGISVPLKVRDAWFGLGYYSQVKECMKQMAENPLAFIKKLENLYRTITPLEGINVIACCDKSMIEKLKKERFFGLEKIAYQPFSPWKSNYDLETASSKAYLSSSAIAFTAFSFPTCSYIDPLSPYLSIASKIMENKTLHKRIREQGGAYGSGAANVPMSGHFYFYSYRDPHIAATKKAFFEAALELSKGHFDARELEEAKLGILQDLDAPIAPGSRAYTAYERMRCNRSSKLRNLYRQKLINATMQDVQTSARTILLTKMEKATMVTFANKELLEKENELLKKDALPLFPI